MNLTIRLERNDNIPAFAGFLRCEPPSPDNHVIVMNVEACMDGGVDEHGNDIHQTQEERKRLIITSLMHEFGHALEAHFNLPVNEAAIEKACEDWDALFAKANVKDLPRPCGEQNNK